MKLGGEAIASVGGKTDFEGIVDGKLKDQAKPDIEGNKPTAADALERAKRAYAGLSFESIKKVTVV